MKCPTRCAEWPVGSVYAPSKRTGVTRAGFCWFVVGLLLVGRGVEQSSWMDLFFFCLFVFGWGRESNKTHTPPPSLLFVLSFSKLELQSQPFTAKKMCAWILLGLVWEREKNRQLVCLSVCCRELLLCVLLCVFEFVCLHGFCFWREKKRKHARG